MFEAFKPDASHEGYTWAIHTSPGMKPSHVVGSANINGVTTEYGVELVKMVGRLDRNPFTFKLTGSQKDEIFWRDIVATREFKALDSASFAPGHEDELPLQPTAFEEPKNCWVVYATSDGGNVFEYGNVVFMADRGAYIPGERERPAPVPCFNFLGLAAGANDEFPIEFAIAHSDDLVGISEAREAAKSYMQEIYG